MSIVETLRAALSSEKVVSEGPLLEERRHDYWVLSHLDDVQDRPAPRPGCVVQPATVDDVVKVVNACREAGAPLIPFGLGSGVCGGVVAHEDAVLIDMSKMNAVRFIDRTNLLAAFDAGKNGGEAEKEVSRRGLTIGHWPQSIDVSTVGGWIATRASGQFSTGYGNIEDIVYSIEAVLPDGSVIEAGKAPRASAGPDLRHLLLGSEGTLGVITGVTLALRRAPEKSARAAFFAKSMADGFEAQRAIIQSGWQPVVLRQYDALETHRLFPESARGDDVLLLVVHEGPAGKVAAEVDGVSAIVKDAGLDEGPLEAVGQWLKDRNHVPTWEAFLKNGVVLDTVEISATWDKIGAIYEGVVASLKEVPGLLAGTAHSSHVYRTGINLYFTFAARPDKPEDMAATYEECWRRIMEATAAGGGGVSHHHGIGRVRKNYLRHDLGDAGIEALRTIKGALDPTGFMNPGVLLPDRTFSLGKEKVGKKKP